MAQSTKATSPGSSPLGPDAGHVNRTSQGGPNPAGVKEIKQDAAGSNNPVQVEQDNRVAKAKADAKAAGGGPGKSEDGLNQDG